MRLLLDTHVLIWWLTDDRRLRTAERDVIADGDAIVHVSAATLWEVSIKEKLGRIEIRIDDLMVQLEENAFLELPISWQHGALAGDLPRNHDDPFDRMLIAQAHDEQLVLVSYDATVRGYEVPLLPAADASR